MKTIRHARGWAALFSFPFPELPGQVPALHCAEQRVSSQPVLPENSASTPNELVSRCKDGESLVRFLVFIYHTII